MELSIEGDAGIAAIRWLRERKMRSRRNAAAPSGFFLLGLDFFDETRAEAFKDLGVFDVVRLIV